RTNTSHVSFDNIRVTGSPASYNTVVYLHGDHLGSIGAVTSSSGALLDMTRFYPFGGYRGSDPTLLTERAFTGHKANNTASNDLGLIYMNARFYSPTLARFISADTLIPDPTNPQQYNRYTYSLNNPVTFFDPSGHRTCSAQEAENDFETCDQNLGVGSDYGNVNFFNNAFPYFFVSAMKTAVQNGLQGSDGQQLTGQALYDMMFTLASDGAAAFVANAFGRDNLLAQAMAEVFSDGIGSARPSDFLSDDVAFVLAAAYMADADRMGQLARLMAGLTPTGMPCSFSANTLVMTNDGLIPISQVTWGTMVLAYNEETGEIDYYPVIAAWSHEDPVIIFLTIDGETIITTPNHPFFTAESEWIQAGSLQIGDEIRSAAWGTGTVETITFTATPQTMYNFTVATAHTYFVGDGQWLVHNQCGGYFKGTEKPWTTGATPNSAYTQFNPKTGQPVQTAIYDSQGRVIVHVDWKIHGSASVGHWHYLKVPGNPASGHGPNNPHNQPINPSTWGLPSNWNTWP
ncbi:MAG: hypothetical protein KF770_29345, partial [Anaerolineae bacterium]|nr:hypothetical protein [Anaerolineae bacterium]